MVSGGMDEGLSECVSRNILPWEIKDCLEDKADAGILFLGADVTGGSAVTAS